MLGFICGVLENAVKVYTCVKADIKGKEVRGERDRASYIPVEI
jgi:hypothetical protein